MLSVSPQTADLEAALQQAMAHHQAGRLAEAERLYRLVLGGHPAHPGVNNALGITLRGQGRAEDALAAFRRTVAVAPDYAPGHSNLGNILFEQGKLAEAEACYRRAVALRPDMADASKNLGLVLVDAGRSEESIPFFRRHAELAFGGPQSSARAQEPIPPHKAQHDEEQREYRKALGDGAPGSFHLEEGGRVNGRAVNPDSSGGEIAARWQASRPQIAVIDNLLTQEALERLRQYCWRSTIWHQSYANGYLGTMPEHGFACPLLAQISNDLRSTYPEIIGDDPLLRWWGFKYDSRLRGINIHADFSAVNVNFWIAPDEANLDPQSGGMIIWDKPAPLDWELVEYNNPNAGLAIRDFLAREGARSVTVPHRANRAVIFDSDLFHETDRIAFKEGYLNRRINITFLYGTRENAGKHK
jgi:Tfp pilus assembly protein PilF